MYAHTPTIHVAEFILPERHVTVNTPVPGKRVTSVLGLRNNRALQVTDNARVARIATIVVASVPLINGVEQRFISFTRIVKGRVLR